MVQECFILRDLLIALDVIITLSSSSVVIKGISIGFTHIDSYDDLRWTFRLSM